MWWCCMTIGLRQCVEWIVFSRDASHWYRFWRIWIIPTESKSDSRESNSLYAGIQFTVNNTLIQNISRNTNTKRCTQARRNRTPLGITNKYHKRIAAHFLTCPPISTSLERLLQSWQFIFLRLFGFYFLKIHLAIFESVVWRFEILEIP